jgi:hypothetical protein
LKNKICTRCHKRKPLNEYYRGDSYADSYNTRCKACCAEVRRRHYLKNRERALKEQRAYYAAHREEIYAAQEEYRKSHREYAREYARQYYWRNRAKILERGRQYRESKRLGIT